MEYYEEDTEGWLWDEATQQWVEDPNWVDPNAEYYDEETDANYTDANYAANNTQHQNHQSTAGQAHSTTTTNNTANTQSTRPNNVDTSSTANISGGRGTNTASGTQPLSASSSGSTQTRKLTTPAMLREKESKQAEQNQRSSSKIDESNIPRVNISNTIRRWDSKAGNTEHLPPSSREQYIVRDCGNATPRHIRLTLNNVPIDMDLAAKSGLAMGAVK